jgi:hypothetical protein
VRQITLFLGFSQTSFEFDNICYVKDMYRVTAIILLLLLFSPIAEAGRRKRTRQPRKATIMRIEKAQLIRSFTDEQINRELTHRFMALYSVAELEAEKARRQR